NYNTAMQHGITRQRPDALAAGTLKRVVEALPVPRANCCPLDTVTQDARMGAVRRSLREWTRAGGDDQRAARAIQFSLPVVAAQLRATRSIRPRESGVRLRGQILTKRSKISPQSSPPSVSSTRAVTSSRHRSTLRCSTLVPPTAMAHAFLSCPIVVRTLSIP